MNLWDILILLAVAVAVVLALRSVSRRKKAGGSCCDGCGNRENCRRCGRE